jgi:hypothetical protein
MRRRGSLLPGKQSLGLGEDLKELGMAASKMAERGYRRRKASNLAFR